MSEQIFVISDLHLGGKPGFQMCGPEGQRLLAGFTRWVTSQQRAGREAHLVIAGDGVDFLAERPSEAFTGGEAEAALKLSSIFERTREVWDAFHGHVAAGGKFTLMLGNHDIELSLPRTRRMLRERLGVGRVEVLYDDEALRVGDLLIEHGNRYDDWNWVDHDQLRRVRRNLSRGEAADFFKPQPGSRFVIDVMNKIKEEYPFVDLLKPENESVAPFLALLRPDLAKAMKDVGGTVGAWVETRLRATGAGGDSTRSFGDDPGPAAAGATRTDEMLALVDAVAGPPEAWDGAAAGGATRSLLGLIVARKLTPREVYLEKLRKVLVERLGGEGRGFDVNREEPTYLAAANKAVQHGAKVVVYGHTHLVKRVDLEGAARYLNTGTWADLMRVPAEALRDDALRDEALRVLGGFADDLTSAEGIARWRRQVPTFALVELGDDFTVRGADVYRYREGASLDEMCVPDGPLDF